MYTAEEKYKNVISFHREKGRFWMETNYFCEGRFSDD